MHYVPFLYGINAAHGFHYPVRLKPDDFWLLIVQTFSNHVNNNAEQLRHMFVNFEGKANISVSVNINNLNELNKEKLEDFSVKINKKMEENLGKELIDILTPNFSTTTKEYSIVCKISIMCAFKKYFNYIMMATGCGIPYLILEGTAEDYQKIIEKLKFLRK